MESEQVDDHEKESAIESANQNSTFSFRTILSLLLTVLVLGALIMLILMFPTSLTKNFFYWRIGTYVDIEPQTGFYIFVPIVMVLLPISGLILLPKKVNDGTRILIYCIWVLYLAVMIVGIVKESIMPNGWNGVATGYVGLLGMFPVVTNFPIQLALLIDKKSFFEWAGFSKKNFPSEIPNTYLWTKRTNAGCFLVIYLWILSALIIGGSWITFVFITGGPLMLLWLIFSDFLLRRWSTNKQLLKDLEANPKLFDNPLFIEKIVRPQWRFFKKRLIFKQIAMQYTDLQLIAQRSSLSLEVVRKMLEKSIANNNIQGSISEDGTTLRKKSGE
jgi:hypothetical protein